MAKSTLESLYLSGYEHVRNYPKSVFLYANIVTHQYQKKTYNISLR